MDSTQSDPGPSSNEALFWIPELSSDDKENIDPEFEVPKGFVLVNAEKLQRKNYLCHPLPKDQIESAIQKLIKGVNDYGRRYGYSDMRDAYADYSQNPDRPFDLSRPLTATVITRCNAYNVQQSFFDQGLTVRDCWEIVSLTCIIRHLDALIRRILYAERYGVFTINYLRPQCQIACVPITTIASDTLYFKAKGMPYFRYKIEALERDVKRVLLEQHMSNTKNGNRVPKKSES